MKFARGKCILSLLPLLLIIAFSKSSGQDKTQTNSSEQIEQEILRHEETDLSLLGKARTVLIEALTNKDTAKAAKVLQYMESKFDSSKIVVLYPVERIFTGLWLKEYQSVFSCVLNPEFDSPDYTKKITPQRDLFYNDIKELSRKESTSLEEGIKGSTLPSYKKDFLLLLLRSMTMKDDTEEEKADYWKELNRQSDEYLSYYRDSEFRPFIRKYLRYVIKTSPWGYGYEFSVGYLSLPGTLSRHIDDFGLLSMAFESSYKSLYGCLRLDIGMAEKIRKEFSSNGLWTDGMKVSEVGALLAFGPMISFGNRLTFTPNLGIGYMNFSPPDEERNKYGQEVSISFPAWSIGFNFDIPLGHESTWTYLRFNVGHRSAMTNPGIAKGGYTFITIGLDLFGRPSYRDL